MIIAKIEIRAIYKKSGQTVAFVLNKMTILVKLKYII